MTTSYDVSRNIFFQSHGATAYSSKPRSELRNKKILVLASIKHIIFGNIGRKKQITTNDAPDYASSSKTQSSISSVFNQFDNDITLKK